MAALQRGDYTMAMRLIRPLAEQGNAGAQTDLGVIYDTGLGVPQDYAQAVVWYHKAADQGDAGALFNLGFMQFAARQSTVRIHLSPPATRSTEPPFRPLQFSDAMTRECQREGSCKCA